MCLHLFSGCAECVFFSCRPVQDGYLTGWHKACRFHTLAPPACQIALGFVARLREPAAWLPGSTKQKYFIECVMYLSEQDGRQVSGEHRPGERSATEFNTALAFVCKRHARLMRLKHYHSATPRFVPQCLCPRWPVGFLELRLRSSVA